MTKKNGYQKNRPIAFLLALVLTATLLPASVAAADSPKAPLTAPEITQIAADAQEGYHQINVSYSAVDDGNYYLVEYADANSGSWQTGNITTGSVNVPVTGLKEQTNYNFRVTALGWDTGSSDSSPSQTASAVTTSSGGNQMTFMGGNSAYLSVSMKDQNVLLEYGTVGGITWYGFCVYGQKETDEPVYLEKKVPSGEAISNGISGARTEMTLEPGSYVFRARMGIEGSFSGQAFSTPWNDPSLEVDQKDKPFQLKQAPPATNVTAGAVTDQEVTIRWTAASNSSGEYKLAYRKTGVTDWTTQDKKGYPFITAETSYTFEGLDPASEYSFSVRSTGESNSSILYLPSVETSISGIKTAPVRPEVVEAKGILFMDLQTGTSAGIFVEWGTTGAVDIRYRKENGNWSTTESGLAAAKGCSIGGLEWGTLYEVGVRIQAKDGYPSSPWSEVQVRTVPAGVEKESDSGFYYSTGSGIYQPVSQSTFELTTGAAVFTGGSSTSYLPITISNGAQLTLNNMIMGRASGAAPGTAPVISFTSGGTLTLSGKNMIDTTGPAILSSVGELRIEGNGSLSISTIGTGISAAALTVEGPQLTVDSLTTPTIYTQRDLNVKGGSRLFARAPIESHDASKYVVNVGGTLSAILSSGGKLEMGWNDDRAGVSAVYADGKIILGSGTKIVETFPAGGMIIENGGQSIGDIGYHGPSRYVRIEYGNSSSGSRGHSSGGNTAPVLDREEHGAYISGYPDGTVRPQANISREETAAIFYRLLDEESRSRYHSTGSSYSDMTPARWSDESIATMAKAGILSGYPDGAFRPGQSITRAEFAAIAARFDSGTDEGGLQFPDIAGHWAEKEIKRAAAAGWISGYPDGTFKPNQPITRAEAVTLINRMLDRQPETAKDLLSGMKTWSDNVDQNAWYYLAIQEAGNGHEYTRKNDKVHETWTTLK